MKLLSSLASLSHSLPLSLSLKKKKRNNHSFIKKHDFLFSWRRESQILFLQLIFLESFKCLDCNLRFSILNYGQLRKFAIRLENRLIPFMIFNIFWTGRVTEAMHGIKLEGCIIDVCIDGNACYCCLQDPHGSRCYKSMDECSKNCNAPQA